MKKNDDKVKPIEVSDQYPERMTEPKLDKWYFFIIETLSDLFTSGFSNYTLTEKAIGKKKTTKDILEKLLIAIVMVAIFYILLKLKIV